MKQQKYFWCDLDGTLRKTMDGKTFIDSPGNQEPFPGTRQAIKHLANAGFEIVGITNQGGCAAVDPNTGHPRKTLEDAITEQQITLSLFPEMEKILFCPTYDELSYCYEVTRESATFVKAPIGNSGGQISCRKPGHGMVLASIRDVKPEEVDWHNSWFVGDRDEDELCAAGAVVNFIWANLFRSYFCSEIVEFPQQRTRMIQQFESLVFI